MIQVVTTEEPASSTPTTRGSGGAGLYLEVSAATPSGTRSVALWDGGPAQSSSDMWPLFNMFAPRLNEIPDLPSRPGSVMTVLDVTGLTAVEFRAIIDQMGVEDRPEPGIFLHMTTARDYGYRIVELWDSQDNFEAFQAARLVPATQALQIERKTDITFLPLLEVHAPRLPELPGLVPALPGGPGTFR